MPLESPRIARALAKSRRVSGNVVRSSAALISGTAAASFSFAKVGESAVVALRRDLYERLISLPMRFFAAHRVGELSSRLSNDLAQIQDTLTFTCAQAIRQSMMLVGGLALITLTSVKLGLVMISSFPVLILLGVFLGRRIRALSRSAQDRLADTSTVVEETLQGIASVKAFGNEPYESRRYAAGLDGFLQIVLKGARLRAGLISFIIVGIFGSIVLVMWYGAHLMKAGQLTHGELTRFILATVFVGGSVSSFAEVFSQIQKTLGATQRVRELLAETREPLGNPSSQRLTGAVRLESVAFRYPSRPDLPVLRDVTLAAKPGERIALVGPSGAAAALALVAGGRRRVCKQHLHHVALHAQKAHKGHGELRRWLDGVESVLRMAKARRLAEHGANLLRERVEAAAAHIQVAEVCDQRPLRVVVFAELFKPAPVDGGGRGRCGGRPG